MISDTFYTSYLHPLWATTHQLSHISNILTIHMASAHNRLAMVLTSGARNILNLYYNTSSMAVAKAVSVLEGYAWAYLVKWSVTIKTFSMLPLLGSI